MTIGTWSFCNQRGCNLDFQKLGNVNDQVCDGRCDHGDDKENHVDTRSSELEITGENIAGDILTLLDVMWLSV